MTIYVPNTNYACFYMVDKDTLRAYDTTPRQNSSSSYTDYFINSHYLTRTGVQTWGNYSTIPECSQESFTTNVYYRNDIDGIMVTFFILLLICFYFPFRIISRGFGRWFKL